MLDLYANVFLYGTPIFCQDRLGTNAHGCLNPSAGFRRCDIWRKRRTLSELQRLCLAIGMSLPASTGGCAHSHTRRQGLLSAETSPLQILSPDVVEMIAERLELPGPSTCERWTKAMTKRCTSEEYLRVEKATLAMLPSFAAVSTDLLHAHTRALVVCGTVAVCLELLQAEWARRFQPAARLKSTLPVNCSMLNVAGAWRVMLRLGFGVLGKPTVTHSHICAHTYAHRLARCLILSGVAKWRRLLRHTLAFVWVNLVRGSCQWP
jgi:hypothetical protein